MTEYKPDYASPAPTEHLSGAIERVSFHSEESGFCVLRVKVRGQRDLVTVIGSAPSVTPGEYLECEGRWVNDRQHGPQFQAERLGCVLPSTLEGIERYLGSGMVKGIGPHFARTLVGAFGERVFDVIEDNPDRLLALPGIGPKRKERVTQAWAEQKVIRETPNWPWRTWWRNPSRAASPSCSPPCSGPSWVSSRVCGACG